MIPLSFSQFGNQLIDFKLGADVDTARWLIQHQDLRLGQQPAAYNDLLLVTTGKRANLRMLTGVLTRIESITHWVSLFIRELSSKPTLFLYFLILRSAS